MTDYKSIQELIVKAALYDGVSTTIGPSSIISDHILSVTFSRDGRYSHADIYLEDRHRNPEEAALYACKRALLNLLFAPYEEIEVNKENDPC